MIALTVQLTVVNLVQLNWQVMWMFLIVKKGMSTRRRGGGPVTTGTVKAE